jgi:uncharacterized Zn-binding protein involved in type VI secretion
MSTPRTSLTTPATPTSSAEEPRLPRTRSSSSKFQPPTIQDQTNNPSNGKGTVTIDGFQVANFGKLYRACGNCKNSVARSVVIKNVKSSNGKLLAGINPNFGGTATISNTCASSVKTICEEFKGTTPGNEPKSVSKGPSNNCKYTASSIKSC